MQSIGNSRRKGPSAGRIGWHRDGSCAIDADQHGGVRIAGAGQCRVGGDLVGRGDPGIGYQRHGHQRRLRVEREGESAGADIAGGIGLCRHHGVKSIGNSRRKGPSAGRIGWHRDGSCAIDADQHGGVRIAGAGQCRVGGDLVGRGDPGIGYQRLGHHRCLRVEREGKRRGGVGGGGRGAQDVRLADHDGVGAVRQCWCKGPGADRVGRGDLNRRGAVNTAEHRRC